MKTPNLGTRLWLGLPRLDTLKTGGLLNLLGRSLSLTHGSVFTHRYPQKLLSVKLSAPRPMRTDILHHHRVNSKAAINESSPLGLWVTRPNQSIGRCSRSSTSSETGLLGSRAARPCLSCSSRSHAACNVSTKNPNLNSELNRFAAGLLVPAINSEPSKQNPFAAGFKEKPF